MIVKLLTEHHLECLSFRGGCRGSSESTLVKLLEISCGGSNYFIFLGVKLALSPEKTDVLNQTGTNLIYLVFCDLEN